MKRLMVAVALAALVLVVVAGSALAAGPVSFQAQTTPPGATDDTFTCPMGGTGMMGRGAAGRPGWAGQPDEVESLLGMTAEEIQAERQAGKSLVEIAAAKGVTEDKLIDTIMAAKKAAFIEAVAAGTLTEAQADAMVANMETMVKTMVERTTVGPMMGGRGGMHGGAGMMGGMRGGMRGGMAPGMPGGMRGGRFLQTQPGQQG